jgi:tetratricopeptide (TPR) repeat protein
VETSLETQLDMAESSLETQLEGFMALQEGFAKLESQTRSTAEKWQTDMSEILTRFTTEIHQATDQFVINSQGEKVVKSSTVVETNTIDDRQDTFLEQENVEQKLKTTATPLANLSNLEDEKDFQSQSEQDDYWQNRGYGLMETGNYQEAINYFDKAIELKPKEFALFYNKACCYALVGRADLATVTLRQAISLNPESREMAKTDSDFDDARHSPKFQSLLQNGAFNGQTA